MKGLTFFRHFLQNPWRVGSIWPSSRYLAEAMTQDIDFEKDFIVELGCGTGAVTGLIAERLSHPGNYLGFEIEPRMHDKLVIRFRELRIIADSATELGKYLPKDRLQISAVISSLPFTTLDPQITQKILTTYLDSLAPGGIFRLFLYLHTAQLPRNRKIIGILSQRLERLPDKIVLENIPPARVITFRRPTS